MCNNCMHVYTYTCIFPHVIWLSQRPSGHVDHHHFAISFRKTQWVFPKKGTSVSLMQRFEIGGLDIMLETQKHKNSKYSFEHLNICS